MSKIETDKTVMGMVERFCPPELLDMLPFRIRLAQLATMRVFYDYLQDTGLSPFQYSSLTIIAENDGITQKELSLASGTAQTVAATNLKKLDEKRLIKRVQSKNDRRLYHIYISKKGGALLDKHKGAALKARESLTEGLSKSEVKILMKGLKHIANKGIS